MHRIDADAHVGNHFSDGDAGIGQPGTLMDAAWANAVQEELCNLLEAMGVVLVKGTNNQLAGAAVAAATALKLVRRDAAGRAQFAAPAAGADASTKTYTDTGDAAALASAQAYADAKLPKSAKVSCFGAVSETVNWSTGITSVTRSSPGVYAVVFSSALADTHYVVAHHLELGSGNCQVRVIDPTVNGFTLLFFNSDSPFAAQEFMGTIAFTVLKVA